MCVEPVVNDHCFSSLSKRQQEELSRVHQTQTQEVLAGFDMAIGRQYDLIEVCAPWDSPLVEEVERQGGKGMRMGLHNGYDLSTRAGFLKAVDVLRKTRPKKCSFVATMFSMDSVSEPESANPSAVCRARPET